MKTLKNHWQIGLAASVILVAGGLWAWRAEGRMSLFSLFMEEQPTYTPMNPVTRDAVITLLNDTMLDRDALVALNLSAQQAESVLSTTRTWQANNAAMIASKNNTISQKRQAVRDLEKAMAMGPFDANRDSQLATARQELKDAQAAYRTTLAALESSISQGLSESQRSTWTAIKTGWGQQMPIRMLDLSDEQRLAVSDARHRYERQHAAASSDQERSAAVTTWNNALESILTANQKSVTQNYTTNYASASQAVATAYTTVLSVQ